MTAMARRQNDAAVTACDFIAELSWKPSGKLLLGGRKDRCNHIECRNVSHMPFLATLNIRARLSRSILEESQFLEQHSTNNGADSLIHDSFSVLIGR